MKNWRDSFIPFPFWCPDCIVPFGFLNSAPFIYSQNEMKLNTFSAVAGFKIFEGTLGSIQNGPFQRKKKNKMKKPISTYISDILNTRNTWIKYLNAMEQ